MTQDEQIREKIASKLALQGHPFYQDMSDIQLEQWWYGFKKDVKKRFRENADQILSLTVSRGGRKCPECKGEGKIFNAEIWGGMFSCSTCKGTGSLKKEEKSIKEIIKEWEDAGIKTNTR